jgi:hypothetical protein
MPPLERSLTANLEDPPFAVRDRSNTDNWSIAQTPNPTGVVANIVDSPVGEPPVCKHTTDG